MQFSIIEKSGFGIAIAVLALLTCHLIGEALVTEERLANPSYLVATDSSSESQETDRAKGEDNNTLALLDSVEPERGQKLFKKCKACHSVQKGGKNGIGPNLWDIVGRKKAGVSAYQYSDVLKDMGGDWSFSDLDLFLADPKAFAKGTKMSFRGVRKTDDRAALIIYLRTLSDAPKTLP
ncbi:MAG: Cytochrome c-552 [Alphaproteobacteria bacterium MarineAlpha3_Bin5]|nr:MAG: Cytochrome c-552 [Alphaproteobacteria bacterium MarineAlpha3_Bin5]